MSARRWIERVVLSVSAQIFFWGSLCAQGYTVSPVVPDFTDISAGWVEATYGTTQDPFADAGLVANRHCVIKSQGTDRNTGDLLKLLPVGETRVVRLGNDSIGGEAESITYHFLVDPDKAVLLLKFAVVFQDPGHPSADQPRFVVRIMNREGSLIEPCAEYDVTARAEIEGFRTFDKGGVPVRWRDWTYVGLDMSTYAGQEVQVQFITYDCALLGHFGYAYFTASCVSNRLSLTACEGDHFTVAAPDGFADYLWQDGRKESATRWTRPEEEMNISCEITSATGCRFTLSALVTNEAQLPPETVFYDTICQGESYTLHHYDLPPQDEAGTASYYNTYFDLANCGSSGFTTLFLTVLQRYYPLEVRVCEGDDYVEHGFTYRNVQPGHYYDTLTYAREEGCDSAVVLHLTVFPLVEMKGNILGEEHPCVGSVQHYTIRENWPEGSYVWEFPEGYTLLGEQGKADVSVQVTDIAVSGQVILVYGAGGCAVGTRPLVVTPSPTYWKALEDTVCTGLEYHKYGFHIPAQDSTGIVSFIQYDKTAMGCDSTITLNLHVFETPAVELISSEDLICAGDCVLLQAIAGDTRFVDPPLPEVAVGDIYCEGGKIVKVKDYKPTEHKAEGIVFWVDQSGKHGWVVNLADEESPDEDLFFWLKPGYTGDVYSIPDYYLSVEAIQDTFGYRNTGELRKAGSAALVPAAWAVDYGHGWYIPAAGQATVLFSAIEDINESFRIVTGKPFLTELSYYARYWTSTENGPVKAWDLALWLGHISVDKKDNYFGVRAVRSF